MAYSLVTAALSPKKGGLGEALGLGATYATDFVERKEITVDGNPQRFYIVWKTAATTAAALNADTTGYYLFPGGSIAFINSSGVQVCRKAGAPGVTSGDWAQDS